MSPQIPQYISKEKPTTEVGGVIQNAKASAQSGVGASLEQGGQVLAELGEKMRMIGNANAESDASIAVKQFQATDTTKRASLPIKDALTGIDDEVRKNREAVANSLFSDPFGKQEWIRKQELNDAAYIIDQKTGVYKRQVSERKVNTLRDLELEKSNYINAQTQEEKQISVSNMETIANNPANEDIYDAEARKKLVDDTVKEANADIKDVESLRRVKEKELKIATDKAINAREKELVNMKVKGVDNNGALVTREDLIRLARDESGKTISPEFAQSFINANKSPKAINAKTLDKDFVKIMEDINKGTKSEETIRRNIENLRSSGALSDEDYGRANTYLGMFSDKDVADLVPTIPKTAWFGLKQYAETNVDEEEKSISRMSRSFLDKIQSGVDPHEAAIEAQREETLYLVPSAKNNPEGMVYMDSMGRRKRIMPNGDLLLEEAKPKPKR